MKCIFTCDVFICLVYGCTYQVPSFSLRNFSEYHTTNGKNKNIFQKCLNFPVLPGSCGALCLGQFHQVKLTTVGVGWLALRKQVSHQKASPQTLEKKNLVAARKEWEK